MSIRVALQFIQLLRKDEQLQNQFLDISQNCDLESCVKLGAEVGLIFDSEDLAIAHQQDWGMRWMLYKG